ncbi:hypothetical protein EST38_g12505 [Candolleomyces aberdarensis]|uniref:SAC domain-containing protein n=1 Tax=Candolleomyces aberdarensis TaxID=2316362 RepID=A0A4Q2D282_9AGAR|nr:hypothetical protein EST38_g12505 [Candolleomyces aberdarensis]
MKKFFAKATKPFAINTDLANDLAKKGSSSKNDHASSKAATSKPGSAVPGLQPKYMLPAVPHPCPHDHLAIVAAKEGLLIRPQIPGQSRKNLGQPSSYLRISWRTSEVIEVHEKPESRPNDSTTTQSEGVDWQEAAVVYGIVGILELFSCSYLLAITSRTEVGTVLDPTHMVYAVKGVIAIPLVEDRARTVVCTLSARNAALSRPSLLPRLTSESILSPDSGTASVIPPEDATTNLPRNSSPRVQFSSDHDVKILTPVVTRDDEDVSADTDDPIPRPASAQSFNSDISSPSSENSIATSPVFKTLASRLSFWSRLSKRPPGPNSDATAETPSLSEFPLTDVTVHPPKSVAEERATLDKLMQAEAAEPEKVVEAIVNATAPPPNTNEERHRELEEKVVRECVRELTKGGMYFAYTFDITRSLQHKQEQIAKSQKQHALLQGLGALPSDDTSSSGLYSPYPKDGEKVSALAEPNPTLPLWRRVDKQFWWNESMSKAFIDAGVHPYVLPIMQGYFQASVLDIPIPFSDHTDPYAEGGLVDATGPEGGLVDYVPADYIVISRRSRYRAGLRYQRRGIDEEAHVANFVETETIMRVEREKQQNVFSYVQLRGSILASDRTHAQNLDALGRHFKRTVPLYGPHTIVNLAEQQGREAVITQNYREFAVEFNDKDVQYCEYDFHRETKGMNAGTSALKGDFTRTGKRDLSGMLNDGVNSLARMYTSTFSDWFSQAVIDFMLGYRTKAVFSEFLLKLQTTDPSHLIRLSKIRAEAVATCASRVLPEGEHLRSGWTLFAPEELNVKVGLKFEEKVLLLSAKALYIVSYDYTLEKVKLYTRVPLGDIIGIAKGAYILSPLEEASRDPEQNHGFVITWLTTRQESRVTSYSPDVILIFTTFESQERRNEVAQPCHPKPWQTKHTASIVLVGSEEKSFAAFKVLPIDPARIRRASSSHFSSAYAEVSDELMQGAGTCREAAHLIVEAVQSACEDLGNSRSGFVTAEDIVR